MFIEGTGDSTEGEDIQRRRRIFNIGRVLILNNLPARLRRQSISEMHLAVSRSTAALDSTRCRRSQRMADSRLQGASCRRKLRNLKAIHQYFGCKR